MSTENENVLTDLYEKISELKAAERITKKLLGELSIEVLQYYHETHDVQPINKLLAALTPVNKRVAVEYFKEFVPHRFDEDENEFGKLLGKKERVAQAEVARQAWLDNGQNIWLWAELNITIKSKKFDLNARLKSVIQAVDKIEDGEKEYEELSLDIDADVVAAMMQLLTTGVHLEVVEAEEVDPEGVELEQAA